MKCEDCCHAEMCKWIDELEGRGCDFLSQGQISLDDINNAIEASFRNGVRSAKAEQEPCDDAISREAAINIASLHCLTIDETVKAIRNLPTVTQKSGKWDRLYNWLNDMRLGIAPDDTVYDDEERMVRESQVDIIDEIMEWIEKADMRGAE